MARPTSVMQAHHHHQPLTRRVVAAGWEAEVVIAGAFVRWFTGEGKQFLSGFTRQSSGLRGLGRGRMSLDDLDQAAPAFVPVRCHAQAKLVTVA